MKKSVKKSGQYMTPNRIVEMILDAVGFIGEKTVISSIMEPSFGEGVFLIEIIRRIMEECRRTNKSLNYVANILNNNIYGIEKDLLLYSGTIERLNGVLAEYGIPKNLVSWKNLSCSDAIEKHEEYKGKFDYVVGNPPFIRIHNIEKDSRNFFKRFEFAEGTSDLYVVFYEIGMKMLKPIGKLAYITPNSFMKNNSQKMFRKYLIENRYLIAIYDFKSSKIFDKVDAYVCICVIDCDVKRKNHYITYREYDMYERTIENVFNYDSFEKESSSPWIMSSADNVAFLTENKRKEIKIKDIAVVQNGVTTNKDSVYILKAFKDENLSEKYVSNHPHSDIETIYFKDSYGKIVRIENSILRRCVKASSYNGINDNTYILFPYKEKTNSENKGFIPLREEELFEKYPNAYRYLTTHKEELTSRDMEKNSEWFLFGRSQGLKNIRRKKIVFKHILNKNQGQVVPFLLDEDVIVYSGIYTTAIENHAENPIIDRLFEHKKDMNNKTSEELLLNKIMELYSSCEFRKYCILSGKEMSGEYVCASTKIIQGFGIF